jgi:hypothetical protein
MKHLNTWKVFENQFDRNGVIETIETVKDILLELSDDNWDDINNRFYTEVDTMPCRGMLSIYIYISRPSGFIRRDIEDIIDRLSSYLGSLGYENRGTKTGFNSNQCKVQFVSKIKWDVSKHLIDSTSD